MVRAWEKVAKVAKEKVEAARYVGFLSSFLFSPAICSFSAYLIRICSYIHHINVSTFCLYFPTATQCGKGGKGDVASDILERFCEVCTSSNFRSGSAVADDKEKADAGPVEVDAVLKAKEKGKTKGITAAAFAATGAMATIDPSSSSSGQIVGIAVGLFVAFCMLICLIKCCCCRKKLD